MIRRFALAAALLLVTIAFPAFALASPSDDAIHSARERVAAGDMAGAVSIMETYVAAHSDDTGSMRFLGDLYFRQGRFDKAQDEYVAVLTLTPKDRETHSRLGAVYSAENRVDDAIAQYEQSLPGLTSGGDLVAAHQRKGDLASFRHDLETEVNQSPNTNNATELGQVYEALFMPEQAIAEYRIALDYDPLFIPALNGEGLARLDLHDERGALGLFEKCLTVQADNYSCLNNSGVAYMQLQQDDRAQSALQQAYAEAPERPEALVNFGFIADDRGDWRKAVQYYTQALTAMPYARDAYFDLAIDYEQHGLHQLAEASLLKGLAVAPSDGWMHYLLGVTYNKEGHRDLATAQFQAAAASPDPSVSQLAQSALAGN